MKKYRGLTKEGKWVYGWYFYEKLNNKHYILVEPSLLADYRFDAIVGHIEVIPKTVGQFTGLKDKDGKWELCKSDIIKGIHKTTNKEIIVEVVWNSKTFQWGVKIDDWIMGLECLVVCYDFEIIGNSHQDPNLL